MILRIRFGDKSEDEILAGRLSLLYMFPETCHSSSVSRTDQILNDVVVIAGRREPARKKRPGRSAIVFTAWRVLAGESIDEYVCGPTGNALPWRRESSHSESNSVRSRKTAQGLPDQNPAGSR